MDNILALALASLLLVLVPGPNVAFIVAVSLRYGRRFGLATVLGTTLGLAAQLGIVVAGYTALIAVVADALFWVKWIGVAVLIGMGIRALRRAEMGPEQPLRPLPIRVAMLRGALLAISNPKTLLFNAAFLPQFLPTSAEPGWQLPGLALLYLLIVAVGDSGWVLLASVARPLLVRLGRWQDRIAGTFLLGAGGLLAASRSGN
ncbi:LysE family translocator [Woeseia oceani]|nr:LysE family translocator [Woeseia oceani]